MGIIYCLTSPSGKKYIGQTSRTLEKRLKEHEAGGGCRILNNAIAKYGINSFTVDVLVDVEDQLLDEYEQRFIADYGTMYPSGYNIRSGGSKGTHCAESREKMRQAKLGANNHNYGKPRSEEARRNISNAKAGEKHHFFGKQLSYEHKLSLSKAHKSYDLPMYLVRIKDRPEVKRKGGYAVVNHPILSTKYFTSSKFSNDELLEQAYAYLNSVDTDAVQRLNGSRGS